MYYPTITELNSSRSMTDVFLGYNHNERIREGEFYDMKNLTSSSYPMMSPRKNRGTYEYPDSQSQHSPQGLITKDALCYVDGSSLFINNKAVTGLILSTEDTECPKQLISMGAYVIIMPDKKWVNTADIAKYGNIEASFTSSSTVSVELCNLDGEVYSSPIILSEAPSISGDESSIPVWIDTSSKPHTLKQYDKSSAMWVAIPTTYLKISATNIGKPFEKGDGVILSGFTEDRLKELNITSVIQEKGDNYIIIIGVIDGYAEQSDVITVARKMPNMDFVIESGNRLWGCRYGTSNNEEIVNEIYASKLGDFKNWSCFEGVSTDSYVASVGTDGHWTGAITYLGYPTFFKENQLHKVYGNYPANFQIQSTACRGVQKGSSQSLAIANETLYYKTRNGIGVYTGALPSEISDVFGGIQYFDAVAGANRDKFYISMRDSDNCYHLFVYDTVKKMWHKEDDLHAECFCSCDGEMYFVDSSDKKIKTMLGSGTEELGLVDWYAVSGIFGTEMPDKKYISRLNIRMSLTYKTTVRFYAEYDSSGEWELLSELKGRSLRTFSFSVRPKRCDHFRLKIEGKGDAKIFSVTKTIEQGSDLR